MFEPGLIQGRLRGAAELAQVRALLAEPRGWSRRRISEPLARQWDWRNPAVQLKDMAARTLLLKLERRGEMVLPARRRIPSNRLGSKPVAPPGGFPEAGAWFPEADPLRVALPEWLPLSVQEISHPLRPAQRALFAALLQRYPCLGHRGTVGRTSNIWSATGRDARWPVCCLARQPGNARRGINIHWLGCSHPPAPLGVCGQQHPLAHPAESSPSGQPSVGAPRPATLRGLAAQDGHPVHLLETFVEPSRFRGTCHRAANGTAVGQTTGRTRQNNTLTPQAPPNAVWLYPLRPDFRQALCAP